MRDRLRKMIASIITSADDTRTFEDILSEELIAQGVIVLPCKVGDVVWIVGEYRGVYCANVRVLFFNERGIEMVRTTQCDIPFSAFGKTVFLTREEAEKARERSENDGT